MISFLGRVVTNWVVKAPVSQLNLFATIFDYTGGSASDDSDGTSLRCFIEKTTYNKDYIHRKRIDNVGLIYSLETKTDLMNGSWAPAAHTVLGTREFNGEYDEVTNEISTDDPNVFIRLKITEQ